jgi:hypothetical protein
MAWFVLHVSRIQKQEHAWMELCAQAANEQHSEKLMALITQIAALLDTK